LLNRANIELGGAVRTDSAAAAAGNKTVMLQDIKLIFSWMERRKQMTQDAGY
jgi:hypothetical protein